VAKLAWGGLWEQLLRREGHTEAVLLWKAGDGGAAGAVTSLVGEGSDVEEGCWVGPLPFLFLIWESYFFYSNLADRSGVHIIYLRAL
jgi:hypothetical protein